MSASAPQKSHKKARLLTVGVPALPSLVKYTDDFTEVNYVIKDLEADEWPVSIDGRMARFRFGCYNSDPALKKLLQAFIADSLTRVAQSTARQYLAGLIHISQEEIVEFIECQPTEVRVLWDRLRARTNHIRTFTSLKGILNFLAERNIGMWRPAYIGFISSSLPLPPIDKFAAVRRGDVFISVEGEAKIVGWIEERAAGAGSLPIATLIDAALIICSYQFAMRPKQIGLLRRRDCRVLKATDDKPTVHLNFRMLKQRNEISKNIPLVRRVKRSWAPIFDQICKQQNYDSDNSPLFSYRNALSVSRRIGELLFQITGRLWTANNLRHSGAMRMVDAGASAEELAEFMGHSSLESGQVYYAESATQAERINQALGLSATYRKVADVGKMAFISEDELRKLKGDYQIAGVPHGIPIAGIGACASGQPACPYNPVTACYGCPKFLPSLNLDIHNSALRDFRSIVKFFFDTSRGEIDAPAYLQLKRAIADIQSVIQALEDRDAN